MESLGNAIATIFDNLWEGILEWVWSFICSALSGFDEALADASEFLKVGFENWGDIVKLSYVLRPFCYTVITICVLIELLQMAQKVDMIKWESCLRVATKLAISKVAIDISPDFLRACYLQAQAWISSGEFSGEVSTFGNIELQLQTAFFAVNGFGNVLGMFVLSFLIVFAIWICGLIIKLVAIGRMFEIAVYVVVSPLPISFLPLGNGDGTGMSSITMRFLKSYIAVCLQGVLMIISMRLFDVIAGNTLKNGITEVLSTNADGEIVTALFMVLLYSIAMVMAITKCGQWSKAIVDTF